MLPGLWSLLFGVGVFSSRRFLPRGTSVVGGWYLISGLVSITVSAPRSLFSSWEMGVIFGVGQSLAAGVLYWNLERKNGSA